VIARASVIQRLHKLPAQNLVNLFRPSTLTLYSHEFKTNTSLRTTLQKDETMATKTTSPLLDLPFELRLRIYDFLDVVHPEPLSIFAIYEMPDVIRKVPQELSEEMLDVYFSKNRFSMSCLIGLPQLFDAAGEAVISKIRRLRLVLGEKRAHSGLVTAGMKPAASSLSNYPYFLCSECYELDIDLTKDEPWFTIRWVHDDAQNFASHARVFSRMRSTLDALLRRPLNKSGSFSSSSLQELGKQWILARE
jgi:hypothetical protein